DEGGGELPARILAEEGRPGGGRPHPDPLPEGEGNGRSEETLADAGSQVRCGRIGDLSAHVDQGSLQGGVGHLSVSIAHAPLPGAVFVGRPVGLASSDRKCPSARESRDFTVPRATPSASAVSASERSKK